MASTCELAWGDEAGVSVYRYNPYTDRAMDVPVSLPTLINPCASEDHLIHSKVASRVLQKHPRGTKEA